MSQLIPDAIAENLLCSQCHHYLSQLPVKVYESGLIKCGRCSSTNDKGSVSLYEGVIKQFSFRCINRYTGCREILSAENVQKHEIQCKGSFYKCIEEVCEFFGSMFSLIQHYKTIHGSVTNNRIILTVNKFHSQTQSEQKRFLVIDELDVVVVLFTKLTTRYVEFIASALTKRGRLMQQFDVALLLEKDILTEIRSEEKPCLWLGEFTERYKVKIDMKKITEIHLTIHIYLSNEPVPLLSSESETEKTAEEQKAADEQATEEKQTAAEDQEAAESHLPKIILTEEFRQKFPGYKLSSCETALLHLNGTKIELICSNCDQYMDRVFSCKLKHYVCQECSNLCAICNSQQIKYENGITLRVSLINFFCKWTCGQYVLGKDKRNHENNCSYFMMKCRVCRFGKSFSILDLKHHYSETHQIDFQYEEIAHFHNPDQYASLYFLNHHIGFILKITHCNRHLYDVSVRGIAHDDDDEKFKIVFTFPRRMEMTLSHNSNFKYNHNNEILNLNFYVRKSGLIK